MYLALLAITAQGVWAGVCLLLAVAILAVFMYLMLTDDDDFRGMGGS